MLSQLRPAVVSTVLFTLLLGLAYPLAITGIGRLAFPWQAEGSLLRPGHVGGGIGGAEHRLADIGTGAHLERRHLAGLAQFGLAVDAQEALRIGLVNQVVPKIELLETCFKFVERVAHVPPETVKINLHISTQGLEMMGLRKAWMLNAELAAMARLTKREEFNRRLEEAQKKGGLEAFLRERDAPFQPEPFGPRAKKHK